MIVSVYLRDSVRRTDREYDYLVPDEWSDRIGPGYYVRVPFGSQNRTETALVISTRETTEISQPLKTVCGILDNLPVLQRDQIGLIRLIRSRYTCTHGDAIRLMVPSAVAEMKGNTRFVAALKDEEKALSVLAENELNSLAQIRVLELLLECKEASVAEIMNSLSVSRSPIHSLRDKGLIDIIKKKVETELSCMEDTIVDEDDMPTPNESQCEAVKEILSGEGPNECLLFGVTGSGKTEVYLRCAQKVVAEGGSVIFLVPEISLTPQMIRWVRGRFPEETAVLHSRLTPRERYDQWNRIRRGEAKVIVGARSAIFAPAVHLRLIIVDEEQDTSYKSETHPRYHARDIARMRSRITGARLVFGSATPAIETFFSAKSGYTKMITLPERVRDAAMPSVRVIDMRDELRRGNRSVLSQSLVNEMSRALKTGEQVILFLNKRGYSSFILCRACGNTILCPHCSVAMTLHAPGKGRKPVLICHYCMFVQKVPEACPECKSTLQGKVGLGTQQLEETVKEIFPNHRVIRMDRDTTATRGAHARLLDAFRNKEADILIGTQMIAKGHDFPKVTVVGIISADMLIRASDFRAGERAFQLITQASGRSGRADRPGSVFIQTYQPDDEIVAYSAAFDYEAFYEKEVEYRKRLGYPPFLAFGSLILSSTDERVGTSEIRRVKAYLDERISSESPSVVSVFGPGPAYIYKVRDRFRFQINIKAPNKSTLASLFREITDYFDRPEYAIQTDIDPMW
ncbi:MAG: primosomal protein N' [Clostridiaceae bacterium]|nr:primosomal protein N' [Clostridiaceae bacterium]